MSPASPADHPPPTAARRFGQSCLAAAVLILATALAYVPALEGGFLWDDDAHVVHNQTLRSADGLRRMWLDPSRLPQYPLLHTVLWAEYQAWGLWPPGYHAVNVLLHALAAVVLWRVLLRLAVPGAWVAAGMFALHPVHVESVAWISEQKNVLSGLLYLSAAWAYLRFALRDESPGRPARGWPWYVLALVLFTGALLSKTVTATLPAALLLVLWWKRGRVRIGDVALLAPMFALGVALGLASVWNERHHVGALGADWDLTLVERVLVAGRAVWFYAAKLIWPAKLTFSYPRWEIDAGQWWQHLFPLGVLAVLLALWLARGRLGKGPLVAALFFCGTLFPALGFFNVYPMRYSFVADHFQYLASIGVLALAVAAVAVACRRVAPQSGRLGPVLAGVALLGLAGLTWRQCHAYRDAESLWRDTIQKNPTSWLAHTNLGVALTARGNLDEAALHVEEALRLKPDNPDAHNSLGVIHDARGELDQARSQFEEALRLNPQFVEAHHNLGALLVRQDDLVGAEERYREALRLKPDMVPTKNNLGKLLVHQDRLDEGIRLYEEALQIDPLDGITHFNLAYALWKKERLPEARFHAEEAVRLRPGDRSPRDLLEELPSP